MRDKRWELSCFSRRFHVKVIGYLIQVDAIDEMEQEQGNVWRATKHKERQIGLSLVQTPEKASGYASDADGIHEDDATQVSEMI